MSGALQAVFQNQRSFGPPPGSDSYTTAGNFTWIAPAGVTSVSAVAIGGGAVGFSTCCNDPGNGGAGGGLRYINTFSVTPGSSYSVEVGMSGGGASVFVNNSTLRAPGAVAGSSAGTGFDGGFGGNAPGNSGGGGGGAGGYTAVGGNGGTGNSAGSSSTGGGGGGGGGGVSCGGGGGGGGGTGILGAGSSGSGGAVSSGGGGGSGGGNGSNQFNGDGGSGGSFGGGGGGARGGLNRCGGNGMSGAVRIVWPGDTRTFPSTNVGSP